jgi:hypothetical protein
MTKSFRSERVFHDSRGWFVAMRPSDARIVRDLPVPGRHLVRDHGIVVGPFVERSDLDTWFVGAPRESGGGCHPSSTASPTHPLMPRRTP